ncbi:MAG: hypothetical protein K8R75_01585 [Deltaproteobacteria bacterium]|nr:hypothetical protein [Deltaproteobacteria bacterium]
MNKIEKRPEGVGKKLLKITACLSFFVFSVFLSYPAFAAEKVPAVEITANDQGETIILADGETLAISAEDGWQTFVLSSDVTIKALIDPATGKATVLIVSGTVKVTSGGQTVTLQKGQEATASPGEGPTSPSTPPAPPASTAPTPPELPDAPSDPPKSPSS